MAKLHRDFEELLRAFNRNNVEYSIVGAFAVGFHAVPRYTFVVGEKIMMPCARPEVSKGNYII